MQNKLFEFWNLVHFYMDRTWWAEESPPPPPPLPPPPPPPREKEQVEKQIPKAEISLRKQEDKLPNPPAPIPTASEPQLPPRDRERRVSVLDFHLVIGMQSKFTLLLSDKENDCTTLERCPEYLRDVNHIQWDRYVSLNAYYESPSPGQPICLISTCFLLIFC